MDDDQGGSPLARLLATVLYMAVVTWATLPDHKRQQIKMRAARHSSRLCSRLARRAGAAAMAAELRTGSRRYEAPYLLSLLRDGAQKAYERERP